MCDSFLCAFFRSWWISYHPKLKHYWQTDSAACEWVANKRHFESVACQSLYFIRRKAFALSLFGFWRPSCSPWHTYFCTTTTSSGLRMFFFLLFSSSLLPLLQTSLRVLTQSIADFAFHVCPAAGAANEGVLANFFNSLLSKKTGAPGSPGSGAVGAGVQGSAKKTGTTSFSAALAPIFLSLRPFFPLTKVKTVLDFSF